MGKLILALALTYIVATGMGMTRAHGAEPDELLREFCVSHAFSPEGYESGIDQDRCERKYLGLPSPFTFLCISYLDRGFPTPIDKLACAMHFGTPHLEQVAPRV